MPASAVINALSLLLLLFTFSAPAYAEKFRIDSAKITKIGNGYSLDATIDYPLTPRVKEAIDNSVPIIFSQQLKLIELTSLLGGYWQWETIIWATEIRYEIRYHALTQHYILKNLKTSYQNSFPDLDEALQVLGQISTLTLPPKFLTKPENITLFIRSELDLHALPTPMRPGALISSKWQLSSPWKAATWD